MSIKNLRDIFIIAFILYVFAQSWYIRHNPEQVGYWLANISIASDTIYSEYYGDIEIAD